MKHHAFSYILVFIALALCVNAAIHGGDFDVYLDAARKLREGRNIYAPPFIHNLQYYYSVFFALLLIPFAGWGWVIRLLWLGASMLMLYRSFVIVRDHLDLQQLPAPRYRLWVVLVCLLSYQFVRYNITMIQVTFFLLWAILEGLIFLEKKKEIYSGSLLGLAINIKVMPLLILPYFFYRGHIIACITAVLSFAALLFLPSLFIGHEFNMGLLESWWGIINPSNKEHLFETDIGTHSLVALLPVYLTDTVGEMPFKRNFLNLEADHIILITQMIRIGLVILSLTYLQHGLFRRSKSKLKILWEASYFILLIPLLLPHQQKYAFLLAMPMTAYLLYYFVSLDQRAHFRQHAWCLVLFGISALFFSPLYGSAIIGRFAFDWTQHYRLLTFAVLFLIPVSLYCSPRRLSNLQSIH